MTIIILCFAPSKAAISFDGTNDYIDLSAYASTLNTTGNHSFSAWIKTNNDTFAAIYQVADASDASDQTAIFIGDNVTTTLTNELVTLSKSSSGSVTYIAGYTTTTRTELFDNSWHHICVVWDGISTKLYIDSISKTISTGTGSNNGSYGGHTEVDTVSISSRVVSNTRAGYFNGSMDDPRIYNRALTAAEIEVLYKAKRKRIGGSLANGLVAHYEMDDDRIGHVAGEAHDSTGNNNHGVFKDFSNLVSNGFSTDVPNQIGTGTSLNFDGVNDYIGIESIASSYFTNQGTLSFWAYKRSGTNGVIFAANQDSNNSNNYLQFNWNNSNLNVYSPVGVNIATSASSAPLNSWHYFNITSNGTNTRIYIDGNEVSTTGTGTGFWLNDVPGANQFVIGALNRGSQLYTPFDGKIDDVRLYNRVLTNGEVAFLYNGSGMDPGTANIIGLWSLDDSAVKDSSGNSNHGIGSGGASLKYTEGVLRR